jgi:hypothetical protein
MDRYSVTVGAVMADAFVSGLTWVGQLSPVAMCLALLTSGVGIIFAANQIADDVFHGEDNPNA